MKCFFALGLVVALSACASTTTLTPQGQTVAVAAQTLAGVAAAQNAKVAELVTGGQLFCKDASGIVAVVGEFSAPTSVIGQAAEVVAAACPIINGVPMQPTPPPADPGATPIALSPTAAPLVTG